MNKVVYFLSPTKFRLKDSHALNLSGNLTSYTKFFGRNMKSFLRHNQIINSTFSLSNP